MLNTLADIVRQIKLPSGLAPVDRVVVTLHNEMVAAFEPVTARVEVHVHAM